MRTLNLLKTHQRLLQSNCQRFNFRSISGDATEIRIPAPYGHIAGKAWGDPNGKPILGLHGWLDNAGTHDHIAPLLNEGYYLVSLDQPGHGFSSKYPPGMQYKMSDGFVFVRRVLDYLKWDKTIIMGHSMGGGIGCWYSAMFPEQVEKLIAIDLLSFGPMPLNKHVSAARRSVKESITVHKKLENPIYPSYSHEDAVARAYMASNLITNMFLGTDEQHTQITQEAVETLMKRGLEKMDDGYTWSADLRLRIPTAFNMTEDMSQEFASKVQCPHLVIKASYGPKYMSDETYERLLNVFRKNNAHFVYREVEGGHHVHLNSPQIVADIINKFLDKKFTKLDPIEEEHRPQFDL